MSVILHSAIPTQILLTDSEKSDIADYINIYRNAHQSPNLVWDDSIYEFSQDYSNYLLDNRVFQYSGKQMYGENLIYLQGFNLSTIDLLKMSIDIWYNENLTYDFDSNKFDEQTGHFTCLIWKSSTTFAMGISIDKYTNTAVVSMNTFIAGNTDSKEEFSNNVLPKLANVNVKNINLPIVHLSNKPNKPNDKNDKNKSIIISSIKMLTESMNNLKLRNPNRLSIINNMQNIIDNLNKLN